MHTFAAGTIENLLFEDPLPLGLSLIVIALVLGFLAFQRSSAGLKKLAAGAFVLAVILFVVASLITTGSERVIERTHELVGHTAPLDLPQFKALVSPQVTVTVGEDASAPTFTGEEVFSKLEAALRNYPIDTQTITDIAAEARGDDFILCQFDVRSDSKAGRVASRWVLTWQRQPDGAWLVTQVQWIDHPGLIGIKPNVGWLR